MNSNDRMHKIRSGMRTGQWAVCTAKVKCRNGGEHTTRASLQNNAQEAKALGFSDVAKLFTIAKYSSKKNSIQPNPKHMLFKKLKPLVLSAVPRNESEEIRNYYEETDLKHFGDKDQPGSKFLNPKLNKVEDVVLLAGMQRGSLEGDDRNKFIALGAKPDAFYEGNRYLFVKTEGSLGIINSEKLDDNKMLEVKRTKQGVPCSLVATVEEQSKEEYGVVIIAKHKETGKDLVITCFPGMVTKPVRNDEIDALEGQKISVANARKILGEDFWCNSKVV